MTYTNKDNKEKSCNTEEALRDPNRECCKDDCEVCVDDDLSVYIPPAPELP